jgi:hypothetical protein
VKVQAQTVNLATEVLSTGTQTSFSFQAVA